MIKRHDLLSDSRSSKILAMMPRTPRVIDIGPGIRPCPIFDGCEYICIEPCVEYVEHLRAWKPANIAVDVVRADASFLEFYARTSTTVLMLDVIEHLERKAGERVLRIVEEFDHAVVFTPLGWEPQSGESPDAWGLHGGHWQKHRSAWKPEDFNRGWSIYSWPQWSPSKSVGAILAVR
jgi:hypothetical protein